MEQYLYRGKRFTPEQLLRTPWLGFDHDTTRQYPIVPFMEYPTLRGWTRKAVDDFMNSRDPIEDIAPLAMIQSWFFFGLWEAALGFRMESKPFIFPTETGPKLGSKALEGAIRKFRLQVFGVGPLGVADSEFTGSATGSKTLQRLRQRLRDSVRQFRYTPETRKRLSAITLTIEDSSNHLFLLQMKECSEVAQSTWRDLVQFSLASREAVRTVFRTCTIRVIETF